MKRNIFSFLLLFLLAGCSDEFLDLAPQSEANANDFFQTAEDFNNAVIATYGSMQSYVGNYFELSEWRSDNLLLDAPTSGTQDRYNIDQFVETSANGIVLDVWSRLYRGISRANEVIARIDGTDFDPLLQQQYEGEARFIRALSYFDLLRFYGGVPLILEPVSPEEASTIGRSSVADVYAAIEEDLQFAATNLPNSYVTSELGRATSDAANALLGKVLLTQQKFSDAITALNAVQNAQLLDDVSDVFSIDNEMNREIIFAIRFNKDVEGEGHGHWFAVSDLSISPLRFNGAFEAGDEREAMATHSQSGNLFIINKFADDLSGSTNKIGTDFIILRYADVLLMLAEAHNGQGYVPDGEAFTYLNQVRERAGLAPLTSTDLPERDSFTAQIAKERRAEFALEGHRWFDLVRLGLAKARISENANITIQDYQRLFPIPQSEIEKMNNASIFPQNEGY
ncbi:MAG: RagB/SusD family nutrient uptake outer membrane protein [Bacteroidetes bacterium]|nr:RagB/SusD family nutrient uptake outer membrane protein [Bacteroidota bacterium]